MVFFYNITKVHLYVVVGIGLVKNRNRFEKIGFGLTFLNTENLKYRILLVRFRFLLLKNRKYRKYRPKISNLQIPKIPTENTEFKPNNDKIIYTKNSKLNVFQHIM